jgi:acetyl-CoA/propionyl-CoA carboxylase biotin carboxyl carrier protein
MVRALTEFEIEGVHTTIPAHVTLLQTTDFQEVGHSTKWVEDEIDQSAFGAHAPVAVAAAVTPGGDGGPGLVEQTVPVEVEGRRYTVKVWLPEAPAAPAVRATAGGRARPKPAAAPGGGAGGSGDGTVTAPMQGTIVKVLVEVGASVEVGQALLVLEAMKMENHINAEAAGTVKEIRVSPGDAVGTGDVLVIIE